MPELPLEEIRKLVVELRNAFESCDDDLVNVAIEALEAAVAGDEKSEED